MPKLGKTNSSQIAQRFISLGWTLKHEFRAEGDSEPYEYVFEWEQQGDAPYPKQGDHSADL